MPTSPPERTTDAPLAVRALRLLLGVVVLFTGAAVFSTWLISSNFTEVVALLGLGIVRALAAIALLVLLARRLPIARICLLSYAGIVLILEAIRLVQQDYGALPMTLVHVAILGLATTPDTRGYLTPAASASAKPEPEPETSEAEAEPESEPEQSEASDPASSPDASDQR